MRDTTLPPFSATLRASGDGAPTILRVHVVARGALDPHAREWLERAIASFATAVNGGMFMRLADPVGGTPSGRGQDATNPAAVTWQGEVRGATAAAYKTLIGVVWFFSRYVAAVQELTIIAASSGPSPSLSLDEVLAPSHELQPVQGRLPYSVVREEPDRPDKHRRLQIEFAAPPRQGVFDDVSAAVAAWDALCMGGFAPPDRDPTEAAISPGEIYLIDAYTLEHPITLFEASEAAFNAILNYAASLSDRGTAIREVVIS